jgi:hypothetical protein
MSWILILVVVAAVLVILAAQKRSGEGTGGMAKMGFPYIATGYLFSAAERSFLGVLEQAVGPEHRVFGKVRIADVASVKQALGNSARQSALNRIAAKHLDFVVCRVSDLKVVCAVELNDKSHGSARTAKRDNFVATLCQTIGLPLLQVPAQRGYQPGEIKAQFQSAIGARADATPAPS